VSLESDLFTQLTTAATTLYTLVGTRVYPDAMPQGAQIPCVVYQRISTPRSQAFGSAQTVVVSSPRIQFSCWAATTSGALAVCAALRTRLLAMSNPVTLENEYTLRDPDTNYARRNLDAFIAHVGE
jgi:hypothetical protein